jgi:hypothetical protein
MKTAIQYVLARDLPLKLCFVLAAIGGLVLAILAWLPLTDLFANPKDFVWFVVTVIVFPLMCFFVSLFAAPMILFSLYEYGARLNGAPFEIGDRVRILVGPHRDRVVGIYELWDQRAQVRVNLDSETKEKVTDVFSYNEICREGPRRIGHMNEVEHNATLRSKRTTAFFVRLICCALCFGFLCSIATDFPL